MGSLPVPGEKLEIPTLQENGEALAQELGTETCFEKKTAG